MSTVLASNHQIRRSVTSRPRRGQWVGGEVLAAADGWTVRLLADGEPHPSTGKPVQGDCWCEFTLTGRGLLGLVPVGALRTTHRRNLTFHTLQPNEARVPDQLMQDLTRELDRRASWTA